MNIGKGLDEALRVARELVCECIQLFLHNPRAWESAPRPAEELRAFREGCRASGISPVVIHMPYLVNLASPDQTIARRSRDLVERELEEAQRMGADFYVIHPGSHKGTGVEAGIGRLLNLLDGLSAAPVRILVENTAGQGSALGRTFREFGPLAEALGGRIGFCLDTAHAFEAGYDFIRPGVFQAMKEEIAATLSLETVRLIHANDSLTTAGSHVDRHQHVGEGAIGREGFAAFVADPCFRELPYILETPKEGIEEDRLNMKNLREIKK